MGLTTRTFDALNRMATMAVLGTEHDAARGLRLLGPRPGDQPDALQQPGRHDHGRLLDLQLTMAWAG